jgi:hypothetical protein
MVMGTLRVAYGPPLSLQMGSAHIATRGTVAAVYYLQAAKLKDQCTTH